MSFLEHEDDSSLEDESTLKVQNQAWSETYSNQDSTSDLSTTSSERPLDLRGEHFHSKFLLILP